MVIITGGAGFIGSVLTWHLNTQGISDILLVDSLKKSEKWKNLVGLEYADYLEKEEFLELIVNGDFDKYNIVSLLDAIGYGLAAGPGRSSSDRFEVVVFGRNC